MLKHPRLPAVWASNSQRQVAACTHGAGPRDRFRPPSAITVDWQDVSNTQRSSAARQETNSRDVDCRQHPP